MPGVRQRQSETKAFVNASQRPRHSSMPFGGCPPLWTNMLLCASVFTMCIAFVLCLQVPLYAEFLLCTPEFRVCVASVLCLQVSLYVILLLCAFLTFCMSPTWDALLTPVLVRHPGNAFELVSKRLRGQQCPRVCTYTDAYCDYHQQIPSFNS